jgi:hypothetical protein
MRIQRHSVAAGVCAAGLAGMAYCHIADVGMKFDEHVYYMAALFCGNIAASLVLLPIVLREGAAPSRHGRLVWSAAATLAALTIAGFVWSRTIGFPQMADHIGEWDTLGLTSLVFEGLVVATATVVLARERPGFAPELEVAR